MACVINQQAPWGDVLFLEGPGDEVYFGEVYRQALQESWRPAGSESWDRVGFSRRQRHTTQRGITSPNLTADQEFVRLWFSRCAGAWRDLPWESPVDASCDNRWGKKYWWQLKVSLGVMCSYYDLFMRSCLSYALSKQCLPPHAYFLLPSGDLTAVKCHTLYDLVFATRCGGVSFVSGEGEFLPPSQWRSPDIGSTGRLCFSDSNGSLGFIDFTFDPPLSMLEWDPANVETVAPDSWVGVSILGGASPFTWSVSGSGFSLDAAETVGRGNVLAATAGACGSAKITITDDCGSVIIGYVRCTAGSWVEKDPACILSGVPDTYWYSAPYHYADKIVGNIKEQIRLEGAGGGGPGTTCETDYPPPDPFCNNGGFEYCGNSISPIAQLGGPPCSCIVISPTEIWWYWIAQMWHWEWECET